MRLSIITVNLNNRKGLKKTIDSVISQTFKDFEWIVIDGGSTDGSKELIEQYAEHFSYWVSEPDTGIYNAMNKGIKASNGEYLLFLNSGDGLCDEVVINDFYSIEATEDIVSGNIIVDDSIYNVRFSPEEQEVDYKFMCDSTVLHPSSFIKKELFEKYGYYDESLKIVSDWKFFFICLIQHSCTYRKWERSITNFNTNGISEDPKWRAVLESEREIVRAEILPRVYRTYSHLNEQNAALKASLAITPAQKVGFFFSKVGRKISSLACIIYLKLKGRHGRKLLKSSKEEKIIVSLTSWKKRIDNVPLVIESILHNTMKPAMIVLNLSEEEFPRKEEDLPSTIIELAEKGIIEIIWTPGNLKAFKKFIPTIKKYPTDAIIAIDDDFVYPDDFIETFVNKHKQMPGSPLSGNSFRVNGVNGHCGCASLVKSAYFGKYIEELMDDRILGLNMDDMFYVFCAALNNVHYQYVGKLFYTNMRPIQSVGGLSDNKRDEANEAMKVYHVKKIIGRYHIDMTKINKPYFKL